MPAKAVCEVPAAEFCPPANNMRLSRLRRAIHRNRVCFPEAVPVFANQPRVDVQWRIVELYFVRGWSCRQLADRYGVCASRIRQLLHRWVDRATTLGYLQEIPPESLAQNQDQELSSWRPSEPTRNPYAEQAGAAA
jgi:hypothetical protein